MTLPALHQRLQFDLAQGQVLDQTRRYVLMRADVLMGLFDELPSSARDSARRALARSVARHGAGSVRAYASQPGTTAEQLLQTMQDSAASLGWGVWQFRGLPEGGGLQLTVSNSPFAAHASPSEEPVCAAIVGMLEALGTALWKAPCQAKEMHCFAQGQHADCDFTVRPVDPANFSPDGLDHLF